MWKDNKIKRVFKRDCHIREKHKTKQKLKKQTNQPNQTKQKEGGGGGGKINQTTESPAPCSWEQLYGVSGEGRSDTLALVNGPLVEKKKKSMLSLPYA